MGRKQGGKAPPPSGPGEHDCANETEALKREEKEMQIRKVRTGATKVKTEVKLTKQKLLTDLILKYSKKIMPKSKRASVLRPT